MIILLQLVIVEPVECSNLFPYCLIYHIRSEVYATFYEWQELLRSGPPTCWMS